MKLAELYTEINVKDQQARKQLKGFRGVLERQQANLEKISAVGRKAFLGISAGIGVAIKFGADQEKAENSLRSALEATGSEVEKNMKRFKDLAGAIQKVTTSGDEANLELMALALNLGVNEKNVGAATKEALGLANVLGMDTKMAIRAVALARKGDFNLLQRYIPELRTTNDETEKAAIYSKFAAQAYVQMQKETRTLTGQLTQLWNEIGDIAEEIGIALLPAIKDVVKWVREILKPIASWIKQNPELVKGLLIAALGFSALAAAIAPISGLILTLTAATGLPALAAALTPLLPIVAGIAAAWAGWEIGKWIAEATGLDKMIQNWAQGLTKIEGKIRKAQGAAMRGGKLGGIGDIVHSTRNIEKEDQTQKDQLNTQKTIADELKMIRTQGGMGVVLTD